jgi:DNA mismatch repair protein MutS
LVLLDEIGRGTSTYDGLALAWACAQHLAEKSHALTLFATHYFELTSLPTRCPNVGNVHLSAKEHRGDIVFLYQVLSGAASQSYGIQVAKLAGVPKPVLDIARARLRGFEQQAVLGDTVVTGQSDLFVGGDSTPSETWSETASAIAAEFANEQTQALLDELCSVDINDLTPRQAMDVLDRLQQLAEQNADQNR